MEQRDGSGPPWATRAEVKKLTIAIEAMHATALDHEYMMGQIEALKAIVIALSAGPLGAAARARAQRLLRHRHDEMLQTASSDRTLEGLEDSREWWDRVADLQPPMENWPPDGSA